jgi:hypothetical protein
MAACKGGGNALHAALRAQMTACFAALVTASRAVQEAEDVAVDAAADADATEIALENVIRDVDAEAQKLDRAEPSLNAPATIFPDGFGSEIDPEGEAQLATLGKLRVRIAKLQKHPGIAAALERFDAAEAAFRAALKAEDAAFTTVEALFQGEQDARRAIREQLQSAYGQLRSLYKARPALAEQFFLRGSGSRRRSTGDAPAPPAPPAQPVGPV